MLFSLCFLAQARRALTKACMVIFLSVLLTTELLTPKVAASTLSLSQAQKHALENDPVLSASRLREKAFHSDAVAFDTWDTPTLSTSVQNLPVDNFSLQQEPMTQLQIGIKQTLPRGNTAQLKAEGAKAQAGKEQIKRSGRKLWVSQQVSIAWYQGYYAQKKAALLKDKEEVVSQLIEAMNAAYTTGDVNTQQQDIVALELDKVMLQEAQYRAVEDMEVAKSVLTEWLSGVDLSTMNWPQSTSLSVVQQARDYVEKINPIDIFSLMHFHPEALAYEFDEQYAHTQLAIAQESEKPQWALQASYGYRQHDVLNQHRSDFISFGVQVDLPSFSSTRNSAQISSKTNRLSAVATDRRLVISRLSSQAQQYRTRLTFASQRYHLLKERLLTQAEYAQATTLRSFAQGAQNNMSNALQVRMAIIDAKLAMLDIELQLATSLQRVKYYYQPALSLHANYQRGS
ncbi:TolC family protein [Alteromonas sp. 345S023]|uniref:TolC family protein n=1 Tax=Alteromonas profundi TaxID=2696062 RepID=A0A7X5LJN0_9ALTE|nr:TolC family protein [Alteromonas profundi]NDV90199.1 TolC family protein [Alteromonas profundi]